MSGGRKLSELAPSLESKVTEAWPDTHLLASEDAPSPQLPAPTGLACYSIKERLAGRWREVTDRETGAELASPRQAALFSLLSSHADVLHAAWPYPTTPDQGDCPMLFVCVLRLGRRGRGGEECGECGEDERRMHACV